MTDVEASVDITAGRAAELTHQGAASRITNEEKVTVFASRTRIVLVAACGAALASTFGRAIEPTPCLACPATGIGGCTGWIAYGWDGQRGIEIGASRSSGIASRRVDPRHATIDHEIAAIDSVGRVQTDGAIQERGNGRIEPTRVG